VARARIAESLAALWSRPGRTNEGLTVAWLATRVVGVVELFRNAARF
jgi:hypothetical protein